ncbi:hypothetical protein IE53DRAFT_388847 [Violaceomyces palustris]|uniref:Uncharacterized protein n=1 Tax=Violaceomyces palustris TaxID=1673888 RepID=A0ACD0NT21_9BASI|nr:hypothetical protein IE53DRAFT_388847 [Violaceomyces palustris]
MTTLTRPEASTVPSPASAPATTVATAAVPTPPPEIESTLSRLTTHQGVTGFMVLSRPEMLVIRSGGLLFDQINNSTNTNNAQTSNSRDKSETLRKVVLMVRNFMGVIEKGVRDFDDGDELGFIRIRTKKYELMVSPSDKYVLVVLQDPSKTQ